MQQPSQDSPIDNPPLFHTWRRWYLVVLTELAVIILLSYVLTETYR